MLRDIHSLAITEAVEECEEEILCIVGTADLLQLVRIGISKALVQVRQECIGMLPLVDRHQRRVITEPLDCLTKSLFKPVPWLPSEAPADGSVICSPYAGIPGTIHPQEPR